ncbi:hypothetical protein HF289_03390 [Acidithiobacillus ferrooxidans]|uniref:hypothetical protein n=1 Tax=Acidithiobacillus ferrooxidans TaxID=920 RepID=UPI001C073BE7|nr:hypothetical protein [Acidithiobacillus ferrooxidans]MBU2855956.1 hypothetical protein [Acidithiobacillus ferrooxidans]
MDNVASASDFLSRFFPGVIPDSASCANTPPAQQQDVQVAQAPVALGDEDGDILPVSGALREAVRRAYGFDPGESLGRRAAIRVIRQVQGRRVSPQSAASLVGDVARFIPDPRAFPDATDHFLERIQDRNRWNRMYMGSGPRADATMAILDMLHDAALLPG